MLEIQKVFDTSLYADLQEGQVVNSITEDLAGLVIEAGDNRPLEERINPRFFEIKDGEVIDPESGKNVLDTLKKNTLLEQKESLATESFYRHLTTGPTGSLAVSISPSGGISPYKEARINVGLLVDDTSIEFYGIPSHFSPTECLWYTDRITEFSEDNFVSNNPDDLRDKAFLINIPASENAWEFLQREVPLDSPAWEKILDGEPWGIKIKSRQDAKPIAEKMSIYLEGARTEMDYIKAGAYGEAQMERVGWKILASSCVGNLNQNLLKNSSLLVTDSFGNQRTTDTSWEYHNGTCVNCGQTAQVGPCDICKVCEKIL